MTGKEQDALEMLLEARHYWPINWLIVRHFNSLEEAIILGYLCSMQDYWTKRNQLKNGKWFYCTKKDMQESTSIGFRRQRIAIDNLKELGLIEEKKMPASKGAISPTRHFHVNAIRIKELLIDGITD